jgi:chorismate mutase / prephenate dehydratase
MAVRKLTTERQLAPLRRRIDEINQALLGLLNERARVALEIGEVKRANGAEVYQPQREQAIIEDLLGRNPGPLQGEHIRYIFAEIIGACRALEHELRVAFLGPEYTYTHQAALRHFGHSAQMLPQDSIPAVFAAAATGRADWAIVPVENSTEGSVSLTLDGLLDTTLTIAGEVMLPIRHALMSVSGRRDQIRKIIAHQQSLGQCRDYLAANFPGCEQEAVASNALAAKMAAADPACAAIASAQAAQPYGLRVVEDAIQDMAQNITRFLVLGHQAAPKSGSDKSTIIFALPEKVGILRDALAIFARNGINLSMIQSRPQRGRPWMYLFYADLKGHRDDPAMKRALAALRRKTLLLKLLGSYPEGRLPES